jgi:predicted site-specific integrase-resolvase
LYKLYNTPQEQSQRAGFVPSWCSVTKTEAKPSIGTRQACEPQANRLLFTHTKRRIVLYNTSKTKQKKDLSFLVDRQYQMAEYKDLRQRTKSFKAFSDISYL